MTTCNCNCPLKKYILTGHGIGMMIVTLIGLLVSIIIGVSGPIIITKTLNMNGDFDSFIDSLPIVKIENGRITDPIYHNEEWFIPDMSNNNQADTKIIANTTVDSIPFIPQDVSAYIAARNIYLRTNDMGLRIIHIPDELNTVITHDVVRSYINKLMWGAGLVFSFILFISAILGFLIGYVPLMIIGFIINRKMSADAWGRAFSLPWILMWSLTVLGGLFDVFYLPTVYLYLIALLTTWIIGVSLQNQTNICLSNSVSATETPFIKNESEADQPAESNTTKTQVIQKETSAVSTPIIRKENKEKQEIVKPKNTPVRRKKQKK